MFETVLLECQSKGMQLSEIITDGAWHTFIWGYGKSKKGSYQATQTAFGVELKFKNWKNPALNYSFVYSDQSLSSEDLRLHRLKIKEAEAKAHEKKQITQLAAKLTAQEMWTRAFESSQHPYLKNKQLKSHYGMRLSSLGVLYVPAFDVEGELWGLQTISQRGVKRSVAGCKLKGCFFLIDKINPTDIIYICEGPATAATVYELTGKPSVAAFGCHNLIEVGQNLKNKYPELKIIFAGDADALGATKAKQAARILKSTYIIPQFKTPHPDYTDWNDLRDLEGEQFAMAQIYNFRSNTESQEAKFILDTLKDFEVRVDPDGFIYIGKNGKSLRQLGAMLRVKAVDTHQNLKRGYVDDFLLCWHPSETKRIREEFIQQFFNPEKIDADHKLLKEFMLAFLRREDLTATQVMLHFIWQIKRKMKELPVIHHMMPIFWGPTGKGKSIAIHRLLEPLKSLAGNRTLDIFDDERSWGYFENQYAVFFDEMAKSSRHNAEMLKNVITADDFGIEPKYEGYKKAKQNATFIGCSNHPLEAVIQDETSNRRFYPFEAFEDTDREVINSINYLELWQSVDENIPCPILSVISEVKETQESTRNKSEVEQFLEDFEFERTHESGSLGRLAISNSNLFKLFNEWRVENGFTKSQATILSLSLELKRLRVFRYVSHGIRGQFLHSAKVKTPGYFSTIEAKATL